MNEAEVKVALLEAAPLRLAPLERDSAVWRERIKPWLERRLESLRRKNDNPKLGADETAAVRGQIAECKAFLAIGEDVPRSPLNTSD